MLKDSQRGAVLYFTVMIMSILLVLVFNLGTIVFMQIRGLKGIGNSVIAFHAADSGVERALKDLYDNNFIAHYAPISLNGDSHTFEIWITQPDRSPLPLGPDIPVSDDCHARYFCIKSVGTYHDIRRAIKVQG